MTTVDLSDAYLPVPIARQHRSFLRFSWEGKFYEFQCLSFSLAPAPRVFTKILKPVVALFRS